MQGLVRQRDLSDSPPKTADPSPAGGAAARLDTHSAPSTRNRQPSPPLRAQAIAVTGQVVGHFQPQNRRLRAEVDRDLPCRLQTIGE